MNLNHKIACLVAATVLTGLVAGCGEQTTADRSPSAPAGTASSARSETLLADERLPAEAKAGLVVAEIDTALVAPMPFDPTRSRTDLFALGRLVEFVAGPRAKGKDPELESGTVVAVIDSVALLVGPEPETERLYVSFSGVGLSSLQRAVPQGTPVLLAASMQTGDDDPYLDDPYQGFAEGATRYVTSSTRFAIADGSQHTWFPLAQQTFDQPLTAGVPAELTGRLPKGLT
ncbi:hypothetical protein ACLM5J_11895 [Nocardioides sp. Bht2]|uniref:hypothetical protein n=1 Tax=Nocardioides sp. Bht2 TaxID=3392297 RepID=UPI0039B57E83